MHRKHCNESKVTVDLYSASSRTGLRCATASRKSALISASHSVQPGTSTTLWDHGYGLVYNAMCLFTPPAFAGYLSQPVTEGGLRQSRPGCLVLRRGGLPVQRRSPTQALTGPSVEYLHWSSPMCYRHTKPAKTVYQMPAFLNSTFPNKESHLLTLKFYKY